MLPDFETSRLVGRLGGSAGSPTGPVRVVGILFLLLLLLLLFLLLFSSSSLLLIVVLGVASLANSELASVQAEEEDKGREPGGRGG